MKLFGFYISKSDWRATCRQLTDQKERATKEANQYRNAWQSSRDELAKVRSTLAKTETQMEAARITHERQLEALHAERKRIEEQAKTTETTYQQIVKEMNEKLEKSMSQTDASIDITNGSQEIARELNMKLDTSIEYIAELEKENGELKHRIAELETNCDALIDENSEYGAEIDRLRALVDSLQEDELAIRCLSLEDRIKELEEWRAKYRAKRTASQRRNRERKRQLKNQ